MTPEAIKLLDEIDDLEVILVEWRDDNGDMRARVGSFSGFSSEGGKRYITFYGKERVETSAIHDIRAVAENKAR